MARPPLPAAALAAALAEHLAGATVAEAAAAHGLSPRALARHKAAQPAAVAVHRPATRPGKTPRGATAGPGVPVPPPASPPLPAGGRDLLGALERELVYAQGQRTAAKLDAPRRAWSKRIEELVKVIERIAPPPPPSPDLLTEALRELDGAVLARVEEHAAQPITAAELVATP